MSGSNYEHCPSCDGKTIYMGDRECPEDVVAWHEACLSEHIVVATDSGKAAEREHICQLMSEEAERLMKLGHPQHGSALRNFAELIGERERQLQQVWTAIRDLGGAQ